MEGALALPRVVKLMPHRDHFLLFRFRSPSASRTAQRRRDPRRPWGGPGRRRPEPLRIR